MRRRRRQLFTMPILFDHGTPRGLMPSLSKHTVTTARYPPLFFLNVLQRVHALMKYTNNYNPLVLYLNNRRCAD